MANCLGQELSTDCIIYEGIDLPNLGISYGDTISSILQKIDEFLSSQTGTVSSEITSDDITSKSIIRNEASPCAAKIVKRDFEYILTNNESGSTFSWNLLDILASLPEEYDARFTKVKVIGASETGTNTIVDSSSASAGVNIGINQFPVSVSITIRVATDCGQVDLSKTLNLVSPTLTGGFRSFLDVQGLDTQSGEINLTDQLNNLETQVNNLNIKLDSFRKVNTDSGETNLSDLVLTQQQNIDSIQETISDPNSFQIKYFNNGSNTDNLSIVIDNLYKEISALKVLDSEKSIEIQNIQSQVDSL